jgi:hypothetical protein
MALVFCDITQPRVKKDYTRVMNAKALEEFVNEYPEYAGITLKELNAILGKFHQNLAQEVIDKREGIALPERLGYLIIASFKRPTSRKIVNWGESRKQGKLVYHMNWDTDNRIGKIVYRREKVNFGALTNIWGFTATKCFTTAMSVAFRKQYNKYIFVKKNLYIELTV